MCSHRLSGSDEQQLNVAIEIMSSCSCCAILWIANRHRLFTDGVSCECNGDAGARDVKSQSDPHHFSSSSLSPLGRPADGTGRFRLFLSNEWVPRADLDSFSKLMLPLRLALEYQTQMVDEHLDLESAAVASTAHWSMLPNLVLRASNKCRLAN